MKKIVLTTLSIDDINDHYEFLVKQIDDPGFYDDMVERFINTFLEDIEK